MLEAAFMFMSGINMLHQHGCRGDYHMEYGMSHVACCTLYVDACFLSDCSHSVAWHANDMVCWCVTVVALTCVLCVVCDFVYVYLVYVCLFRCCCCFLCMWHVIVMCCSESDVRNRFALPQHLTLANFQTQVTHSTEHITTQDNSYGSGLAYRNNTQTKQHSTPQHTAQHIISCHIMSYHFISYYIHKSTRTHMKRSDSPTTMDVVACAEQQDI